MTPKAEKNEEKSTEIEKLRLIHEKKKLFDKVSIFHFLFGSLLGIGLGLLNYFIFKNIISYSIVFLTILGVFLIPILEYTAHKIITGYSTLTTKNAIVDLLFATVGMFLFLLISLFFR